MNNIKTHLILLYGFFSISLVIIIWNFVGKTRVAYVKSGVLMEQYAGMKEARTMTEQKIAQWQVNLDTLALRFEKNINQYKDDYNKMSPQQRQDQEDLLQKEEIQLNTYKQNIEKMVSQEEEKNTQGALNQVNSFIEKYSKENNYDLVLGVTMSGNILYGSDAVDITDEVIAGLNEEYNR